MAKKRKSSATPLPAAKQAKVEPTPPLDTFATQGSETPTLPPSELCSNPTDLKSNTTPAPPGPLDTLAALPFYAEPPVHPLPLSNAFYPTDENGCLAYQGPQPLPVQAIYELVKAQVAASPDRAWAERVANGVVLHLKKEFATKDSPSESLPDHLPYHTAFEAVLTYVALAADVSLGTAFSPDISEETIDEDDDAASRFPLLVEGLELLWQLQELVVSPSLLLLRHSPTAQRAYFRLLLTAMAEAAGWLSGHSSGSVDAEGDSEMDGAEQKRLAHQVMLLSARALNKVLSLELSIFHRYWPDLEETGRVLGKKIQFPFEWVRLIAGDESITTHYGKMVMNITQAVSGLPVPQDGQANATWDCFCEVLTFFWLACTVDGYVTFLITSPDMESICTGFAAILEATRKEQGEAACRVKYHVLRIFTVLCEKDEPYFLDHLGPMGCGMAIASAVLSEASLAVTRIRESVEATSHIDLRSHRFLLAKEAVRVMELFSYDSNFVTAVVEQGTLFILQVLSVAPEHFLEYLKATGSFQQYICILVFRIIANLHCYNPDVSPEDHEGKFIRTILKECATLFEVAPTGELLRRKPLVTPHVMANLFYLFQWVTLRSSYTYQEHSFWADFLKGLGNELGVKYPVIKVNHPGRLSAAAAAASVKSESNRPRAPRDENGQIKSESHILRGLSVSFGKVRESTNLKALIQAHGGTVLAYVSKSVTHILVTPDEECLTASQGKIQSAASKQVPVCSDELIYESIEKGKLQHERIYLLSDHAYKRRI